MVAILIEKLKREIPYYPEKRREILGYFIRISIFSFGVFDL